MKEDIEYLMSKKGLILAKREKTKALFQERLASIEKLFLHANLNKVN